MIGREVRVTLMQALKLIHLRGVFPAGKTPRHPAMSQRLKLPVLAEAGVYVRFLLPRATRGSSGYNCIMI